MEGPAAPLGLVYGNTQVSHDAHIDRQALLSCGGLSPISCDLCSFQHFGLLYRAYVVGLPTFSSSGLCL